MELPGLSAFGVGRSSSLGWTPAKENSPSESVTKLCLKLPSQIEQTAPLRQVAESHFTSSQEPTEGPPPGLVMNSHLQQSSTAKIFPADKMGQINHNHGYAMYRQAVDRFNGFGMRDTPAAAMPTPVDNNYRLKNF